MFKNKNRIYKDKNKFYTENKVNILSKRHLFLKDMTIFLNDYVTMSLHLCLVKAMPALYALTNPTIEVYDGTYTDVFYAAWIH